MEKTLNPRTTLIKSIAIEATELATRVTQSSADDV